MKLDMKKAILAAVGSAAMFGVGFGGATYYVIESKAKPVIQAEIAEQMQKNEVVEKEKEKVILDADKGTIDSPQFENLKKVAQELETWKAELNTQKDKQLAMDQELIKREQILKTEKEALDREKNHILEMQNELNSKILMVQSSETTNFKDLAGTFSKMKVDQVVIFLKMFPDNQASRLMSFLPRKQLVKVLEQWSTAYPDDRERLVKVTSQIRRVIVEPLAQNAAAPANEAQVPEVQTQ